MANDAVNREEQTSGPLFKSIGDEVEKVDEIENGEEETRKPVEEIESMCIHCEQNVCRSQCLEELTQRGQQGYC